MAQQQQKKTPNAAVVAQKALVPQFTVQDYSKFFLAGKLLLSGQGVCTDFYA